MLPDGRIATFVAKGSDVRGGDFGWTVAGTRDEEVLALLARLYPDRAALSTAVAAMTAVLPADVSVLVMGDVVHLSSPYSTRLDIKAIGGRWDPAGRYWTVPGGAVEALGRHLIDVYGTREQAVAAAQERRVQEAAQARARQEQAGPLIKAAMIRAAGLACPVQSTTSGIRITGEWRPGLPEALRAAGGRWDRAAWNVPADRAMAALDAVERVYGTTGSPTERPAHDGGTPTLPFGSRSRTQREDHCYRCGGHVPAQHGTAEICGEGNHSSEDSHDGWCDNPNRWHATCRECLWRQAYGIVGEQDVFAWVRLGLPASRVRLYLAARMSPDEATAHEAAGGDLEALATLAGLTA